MEDDNGARWPGQPDGPAAEEFGAGEPVADEPGYPGSALGGARPARPGAGQDRLLVVPRPDTGESRVDAALSLLDDLTELPVTEHPAVFERVHAELGEVLGELRSGPLADPAGRDGN